MGSDCSDASTNEIILNMVIKYSWLSVRIFDKRRGKASVLNNLAKDAQYKILVFTDSNTEFSNNALKNLVRPFCNAHIGGVSGGLILNKPLENKFESDEER